MTPILSRTAVLLLENTIEFSLIALVAFGAVAALRSRSAALRHWILATTVACAAVSPLLGHVVPTWQVPVRAVSSAAATRLLDAPATKDAIQPPTSGIARSDNAPAAHDSLVLWSVGVWTVGALLNLLVLGAGMFRLARVKSRAHPVGPGYWSDLANEIARAYGIRRRVLLLHSDHPTLLVTWGMLRPTVILPRSAQHWPEDRVRVVLSHEMAHIQRGDWLAQIAAELLRSMYWFNPLAWILCRTLRHESEQAADDAVLNVGIEGRDYAAHLLDVARAVRRHGEAWWPAPAIVRSSTLERRITAMLDAHLDRRPLTHPARALSVVALFALAAAVASAQGAVGTFSGAVLDPMNRTLPNATLVLTNVQTKAKHEVRSDENGRFEFAELPRGDYALEIKYPGFMALHGQVTIAGSNVQRQMNLEVGTLQETITVLAKPGEPEPAPEKPRAPVPPRANDCTATAHGGNLRPPLKLLDVRPVYPVHLANTDVGGTVLMQAVIAKDGTVKDVRVVGSAHPDLDASAVNAVRQWRFDSTLLNCMPIEVTMNVKVMFKAD
jgi:TonB family protein